MRVFSKKNFQFTNPATGESVRLNPLSFANLPEWVKKDPLFLWAIAEKSLEVFGEDKPAVKKSQHKREAAKEMASANPQAAELPEGTEQCTG